MFELNYCEDENADSIACSVPHNSPLKCTNLKYTSLAENMFYTFDALYKLYHSGNTLNCIAFPGHGAWGVGLKTLSQASPCLSNYLYCTVLEVWKKHLLKHCSNHKAFWLLLLFSAYNPTYYKSEGKAPNCSTWVPEARLKANTAHNTHQRVCTTGNTEQHWQVALFGIYNHLYQCKHVGIPYKNIQKCFFSRAFAIQCT